MEKKNKVCFLEVKAFDEKKGQVTFYYGSWNKDRDKDTLDPDALNKTLLENKGNIYHNEDHGDVIGVPIAFGQDDKGPWVTSQLLIGDGGDDKGTVAGHEAYSKYKANAMKGHSMEYVTKKADKDPKGGRLLKEIELWGVTSMTKIPANAEATLISMKGMQDAEENLKAITLLISEHPDKCTEGVVEEFKKLQTVIEKKSMGIKCKGCGLKMPEKKEADDDSDDYNMKCAGCGKMLNAKGEYKSSSFIAMDDIEKSHTFLSKKNFIPLTALEGDVEFKTSFTAEQRKKYAKEGVAMADGSFPIRNATDLEHAIKDWGRAGSSEAVKAHIKKRAKELGLEDKLPADWEKKSASIVLELKKKEGKYIKMRETEQPKDGARVVAGYDKPGTVVGMESVDRFNYSKSQMESRDILKVEHPAGTETYAGNTTMNPSEPFHKFYDAQDVLVHEDDIMKKLKK